MIERARKDWLEVVAKAPAELVEGLWQSSGKAPAYSWLRPPECGAVMVRGRAGGTGAAFNLGEMTVTRCTLRLERGLVGHGYVPGRDKTKATIAALCDALMQDPAEAPEIEAMVLIPLAEAAAERRAERAGKAAATKVDFFTMVRGEDE